MAEGSPILIAYDGSEAARAAVRAAGDLFTAGTTALVLTVWEPALAEFALIPNPSGVGGTMLPYDPAITRELERSSEEHAKAIANDGAVLAREVGLQAQALVSQDLTTPAQAIVEAAEQHGVRAIAVGSRGLGGLKAKLLGSTSTALLRDARVPVLVVRHPDEHGKPD